MQTFDQSIMKLHKEGLISFEEAMNHASNPDDLDLRLRGITGSAERWQEEEANAESHPSGDGPSGFSKY
jgi:Tfp pilus assembly ATPase PilU